jgi:maltose/moltooligosaccharide transporter
MIVIPMILQTLTFGYVYEHFLSGDPGSVMHFAGVLLLLAALATLRIRVRESADTETSVMSSGH